MTSCTDVRALAAETALGLVSGGERGEVLDHLDTCEECRELVHELSAAVDSVLVLSPQAEPPSGFEQRVLARIGVRRRRAWPVVVGAVAAALLLVAGFAVGRVRSDGPVAVRELAMRTPTGRVVGEAYLHDGDHPWVFAAVPGWKDDLTEYRLRISLDDGRQTEIPGVGSWASVVDDSRHVRALELIDADGRVWCSTTTS
jgi:hypothetical protein